MLRSRQHFVGSYLFRFPARIRLRERHAAGARHLYWVMQRHLECVLYNRSSDGGSSGAVWKLLNQSGLGSTALQVNAAAMKAGWGRAMVVEDPSALESTSSNTFVELFKAAGGIVESYEAQPVQRVDPSNNGRLQRFKDDMAWSWVPTVVVVDAPDGLLSQELRAEQQQGRFGGGAPLTPNWIWLTEAEDLQDAPVVP